MFVRRRPLLRAAVVGGGAYLAGKRSAHPGQGSSHAESDVPTVSDQLAQLSNLHQQGSLSDAEFAAAKARLLGS
jgi:outer membrane murein-binding lipoprotein Lpp